MDWKLSPSAKILMLQAQEEANHLEHSSIAYPHIELALLRFDRYAEQLLRNEGYDTNIHFLSVQNIITMLGCGNSKELLHDSCIKFLHQAQELAGAEPVTVFHILLQYFHMLKVQDSSPLFGSDLVTGYILRKIIEKIEGFNSDTKMMTENEQIQEKQLRDNPEFVERLKELGVN